MPRYPLLVSVITPTWQRHDMLTGRCIPSVTTQAYERVEHIVVSDGPDEELRKKLGELSLGYPHGFRFEELHEHDPEPHWGHHARYRGVQQAAGDLIAYCDDDDALRPEHCNVLAAALAARPDCGFALSRMCSHSPSGEAVVGHGTPVFGNLGTPMIMHRKELLNIATWDHASAGEDWELALAWMNAGVRWCHVDAETVDVYPSTFR